MYFVIKLNNMVRIAIFISLGLILGVSCSNQETDKKLVWSDEFDYNGPPDPSKWGYEIGYIRNHEMQYYTDDPDNVTVRDGKCYITARLEGPDSVTSASINTMKKQDFLYGRIEVRAKIPSALGSWPAIWMLGTNHDSVRWPACGEIDIMEHVGFEPDLVHAHVHTKAYNHLNGDQRGKSISVTDPWTDFHLYAIDWTKEKIDFFYDDSLYFTYQNDGQDDADTWPFSKPQYLLLNLAYGGSWGAVKGVDTTRLPLEFVIDYVRYYK